MSTLNELMAAHTAALAAYDATHDHYDKSEDVEGKAVDAARDALLEYQPVTLEEVTVKAAYMLANRTFTEWDGIDAFKLILALTPAVGRQA